MPDLQQGNELITVNVFKKVDLQEGMSVGDLGCGNLGYYAVLASKIVGKPGIVYALDILKSALESVTSRIKQMGIENIRTVWSNLEIVGAAKIADQSLDVAYLHNVLFQSQKDDLVVKEAARLLKPGGKLMVIDWKKTGAPFGPPVSDRISPEDVKNFAQSAGLRLSDEFDAGPYHFGLIFIK